MLTTLPLRINALKACSWTYRRNNKPVIMYKDGFHGYPGVDHAHRGPSAESLRLWGLGEVTPSLALLRALADFIREELNEGANITHEMFYDSFRLDDFFRLLRFDPTRSEGLKFTLWAEEVKLCSSFTSDRLHHLDKFERENGPGLFKGTRVPTSEQGKPSLFGVAVYPRTSVTSKRRNKHSFVPVALTTRSANGSELYSYVGAVFDMTGGLEWALFQEGSNNLDRMRIMTCAGRPRHGVPYAGHMVTMTEGPRYHPITYRVEIEKVRDLAATEEIVAFLRDTPTPTKPHEKSTMGVALRRRA